MKRVTGPDGDNPITDEQIDQLKDSVGSSDRDYLHSDEQKIVSLCNVALIEGSRLGRRARERCAETYNARLMPKRST